MSRTVPEWQGRTDDSAIPSRVQERVAARNKDNCALCGNPATPGEIDHIIPLILGGQHRESNLQWLCRPCHGAKTKLDVKLKAKVARIRKRNLGIRKSSRKIQSRGFARVEPQRSASRGLRRTTTAPESSDSHPVIRGFR